MKWGKVGAMSGCALVFTIMLLLWAANAPAASFDCAKASTAVEKMICADTALSKLDEEMSGVYKAASQRCENEDKAQLKSAQLHWLKERNTCRDADCVKRAYEVRLQGLAKNDVPQKYQSQEEAKSNFSGQWHIELCDKNISEECGGFMVYLIQTGEKICGDHFFATPGGGRLNEGAPRSIVGSVTGKNVANIIITSGRNGAVYRIRAIKDGDTLNWKIIEEIKSGSGDDSALVLDYGNLKREKINKDGFRFQLTSSACKEET